MPIETPHQLLSSARAVRAFLLDDRTVSTPTSKWAAASSASCCLPAVK